MRHAIPVFMAALTALTLSAHAEDKFTVREDLPMQFPEFRLPDLDGNEHRLSDWEDSEAVVFFLQGNGCPIVRQSFPYLKEIRDEFEPRGVQFVMINSNTLDDPASIKQELEEYDVDILTLKDELQVLVHALDSERTAESFLVDPKTGEIIYRGEADDRFGYGLQRSNPQEFYLADALNGWLERGEKPETRKRITKGCLMDVPFLRDDVAFEAEVKPVLESLCASCDHTDPEQCISAWDAGKARENADTIWTALATRQTPDTACCEPGEPLEVSKEDALAVMSWLKAQP